LPPTVVTHAGARASASIAARVRSWFGQRSRDVARMVKGQAQFAFLTFDPDDPGGRPPGVFGSQIVLSRLGRVLTRRVLESGAMVAIENLADDEELADAAAEHGVGSVAALPIQVRGRTVGVASFYLDSAEGLQEEGAREVLDRLRQANLLAAMPLPQRLLPPAEPAQAIPPRPAPAAVVHHMGSSQLGPVPGKPLVDLVSAVLGDAMSRLDAESIRADEMSEANRLKSEFISVVSHELRSPLTYVLGFSEILAERDLPPERSRYYAGEMYRESRRMLQLVNDLLDISRMELGRYSVEQQALELAQEIDQILRNAVPTTDKHQLVTDCPSELVIWADPMRLWQVLQNLVSNAIRYSPNGGEIRVAVSPEVDGRDLAGRPMVRIAVVDQGIGIPAADRDKIFEKFYRVDSELRSKVRGSGLGLSIVQAIVESHGGRIWVESEVGKGSQFIFTMPFATEADRASAAEPVKEDSAPALT
jgi:signal transduction histidine kinase